MTFFNGQYDTFESFNKDWPYWIGLDATVMDPDDVEYISEFITEINHRRDLFDPDLSAKLRQPDQCAIVEATDRMDEQLNQSDDFDAAEEQLFGLIRTSTCLLGFKRHSDFMMALVTFRHMSQIWYGRYQ